MTEFDHQRITSSIGDAFAILCVRAGRGSAAEKRVRLGFEAILRQLGTPPLRMIARSVPPAGRVVGTSSTDWRQIIGALERCLAIFRRYEPLLNANQRRTRELVEATLRFAHEELRHQLMRRLSASPVAPAPDRSSEPLTQPEAVAPSAA